MTPGIRVRRLGRPDVPAVVRIHLAAFPGFFLATLGPRFLSIFYRAIADDPRAIGLVAVAPDGTTVGFVGGAIDPRGFYRRLRDRQWWRLGLAALPVVLRRPGVVRRVVRGASHPDANAAGGGAVGLFSIGVDPAHQTGGVGRALVEAFLSDAAARGGREVRLTTDADGNEAVNAFYRARGFAVSRTYVTPEGRRMHEYTRQLSAT